MVDLILDRRDGVSYSPSEFEEEVKEYCEFFPSYIPVYDALINGSEDDVKDELSGTLMTNGVEAGSSRTTSTVLTGFS